MKIIGIYRTKREKIEEIRQKKKA